MELARSAGGVKRQAEAIDYAGEAMRALGTVDGSVLDGRGRRAVERIEATALLLRQGAALDLGNPEDALATGRELLGRYPDHADRDLVLLRMGQALEALGRRADALEVYRQVGGPFSDRAQGAVERLNR